MNDWLLCPVLPLPSPLRLHHCHLLPSTSGGCSVSICPSPAPQMNLSLPGGCHHVGSLFLLLVGPALCFNSPPVAPGLPRILPSPSMVQLSPWKPPHDTLLFPPPFLFLPHATCTPASAERLPRCFLSLPRPPPVSISTRGRGLPEGPPNL